MKFVPEKHSLGQLNILIILFKRNLKVLKMNGLSTVFQSYQDDGKVIMKGSCNEPCLGLGIFLPAKGSNPLHHDLKIVALTKFLR